MKAVVVTILGARPQFVKSAAVAAAFRQSTLLTELIIHTGQHFDKNMSDLFFDELSIPRPVANLGIAGVSHGAMTGRMLEAIEAILTDLNPIGVLVYGDTNSTLAGALAAAKMGIPIGHIEAGLRSFNRTMPEEINRIVTDHVSDILFTPTDRASANLLREGIDPAKIYQVGDVMFDVSKMMQERATKRQQSLKTYGLEEGNYVLCTVHRQENTDNNDRLESILRGLQEISKEIPVLLLLHPRMRARLSKPPASLTNSTFIIADPVGYVDMAYLESKAKLIATDSGGVQKEAYFHGVPCVTLRTETEWPELVEMGWNRLAPPGATNLADSIRAMLSYGSTEGTPYGDGDAALKIVATLEEVWYRLGRESGN